MRERLQQLPGEACWWFSEHLRVKTIGTENVVSIREHLITGSLLVYFNHLSIIDPALVLQFIFENLHPSIPPVAFASLKHLDPNRNRMQSVVMKGAAAAKRFELLPTVQEYDRASYPDYAIINLASLRRALKALGSPGGIVLIAPEETRSKTGALQEAKDGIGVLFGAHRVREHVLALPIGIVGTEKIHRSGQPWLNPFTQVTVTVGKPLSYEEVKNAAETLKLPIKDVLMCKLAQLLPDNYRGVYSFVEISKT